MLYNPKWERHTKEPSVSGLIAFLAGQNPATEYNYTNPMDCLLCRYLRSIGHDVRYVEMNECETRDGNIFKFPDELRQIAIGNHHDGWTYGGALELALQITSQ